MLPTSHNQRKRLPTALLQFSFTENSGFLLLQRIIPTEEFVNAVDFVVCNTAEHICEPGLQINAIKLGRLCRIPNYAE